MSALNIEAAHAARRFADRQVAIHERVMQTQMRSLDAGATMSALEHMGPEMSENMVIPLDAALALHQEGTDIPRRLEFLWRRRRTVPPKVCP